MTTARMDENQYPPAAARAPKQERPAEAPGRGRTILLAEDDEDIRLMMKMLLETRGYRVVEAADGQQTLQTAEGERPDLILMDLQLPRLNGLAVAHLIRENDALRRVPIVIVSAHDAAKHRNLALAAGCNAYVQKPVDFDELDELIASLWRA